MLLYHVHNDEEPNMERCFNTNLWQDKYGNSVNGDAPTRITDCESIKTGIRRVLDYILRQCIKHASEQELSQQLCCLGCFRMKT